MAEERMIELKSGFDTSDGKRRIDLEFTEGGDITLLVREKASGSVDETVFLRFADIDSLANEVKWARETFIRANGV